MAAHGRTHYTRADPSDVLPGHADLLCQVIIASLKALGQMMVLAGNSGFRHPLIQGERLAPRSGSDRSGETPVKQMIF
jgi:hypothetical protein